jgi:hypothetical protein
MPAIVHPIHPASAVHDDAIIAELRTQIADMREQRDTWRDIATAYLDLIEELRAHLACRPRGDHAGTGR